MYLLDEGPLFDEVEGAFGPLVPVPRLHPRIHYLGRVRFFHLDKGVHTTAIDRRKGGGDTSQWERWSSAETDETRHRGLRYEDRDRDRDRDGDGDRDGDRDIYRDGDREKEREIKEIRDRGKDGDRHLPAEEREGATQSRAYHFVRCSNMACLSLRVEQL